ncbi:MAG: DUF2752 domain-containing protein [Candidatus Methanofastidiosia archaeon]
MPLKRAESIFVILGSFGVFTIARILEPNPSMIGTFPIPCLFNHLTGIPGPLCGLTTSFAYMARLDLLNALKAHLLGPILFASMIGYALSKAYSLKSEESVKFEFAKSNLFLLLVALSFLIAWIAKLLWF